MTRLNQAHALIGRVETELFTLLDTGAEVSQAREDPDRREQLERIEARIDVLEARRDRLEYLIMKIEHHEELFASIHGAIE